MKKVINATDAHANPLFCGLSEQDRNRLMQGGKVRHFKAGENVFLFGDPIRNFYIVQSGAIQLFRETPDGHEMTSEVIIEGDAIGETEILQLSPTHRFNALAIKDSALMEFPVSWLRDNIKQNGALALNILSMLSRRAHIASVEAEHKATMTAAQQVACFLERLCILHDFDAHGFDLPYSKTLIASRLGMELETFSRALSKVRDHGISIQGNRVSFENINEIEDFACADCSMAGNCAEHEILRQKLLQRKPTHTA